MKINEIICGDALKVLKTLPDESVDCCITSPPYFNLRDYKIDGQIGLETTWQEYIEKLCNIFDEVKRVLKKEGTCFVNLGDSYGTQSGASLGRTYKSEKTYLINRGSGDVLLKPKNVDWHKSLMLLPERFAIKMVDLGWKLRNKIVWVKPNAMPESVQDRWKKAHEYIFFFVKNYKYNFNLDAIRTPHKDISVKRAEYEQSRNALGLNPSSMGKKYLDNKRYMGMPARMVKLNPLGACPPDYLIVNTNCSENDGSDEHYATYPQELISPLIRGGCPQKGLVLDPFMGSGTTGLVAQKLGRNYLGIELNPNYIKIASKRLAQGILL